jgi:co-chaperonin GroES (HSP10)
VSIDLSRFPEVDPGRKACGVWVIVQKALPKEAATKSGLILPESVKDTNQYMMSLGRVISIGGAVGKDMNGEKRYGIDPEFKVGDFVEVPKASNLTWSRPAPNGKQVHFSFVKDDQIIALATDDITDVTTV